MIVSATSVAVTAAAPSAPSLEEAKQQRLADKLRVAKQAIATLKNSALRPNDERKSRAREKLESIRKRIQQLKMMGGTPRQIAALARELKEAVKAYGQAGGSPAEAGSASVGVTLPAEATPAEAAPDESVAPGDGAQDAASAESTPSGTPAADADKLASAPDGRVENPYDKAIAAHAESVAAAARKSSDSHDDRVFVQKARQLAQQLKSAALQAAQRAKQSGKTADAADAAEAAKAAKEADKTIDDLQRALGGAGFPAGSSVSA